MKPRAGALVTDDLPALAREALDRTGLTLTAAAKRLGVAVPAVSAVSDAMNQPDRQLSPLRRRIIELGGYRAEGPLYRLRKV